jgi:thioredoxin 1
VISGAITIAKACPNLAAAALVNAKLAELPDGTLLRAGEFLITQKELDTEIAKAPEAMQEQLRKNAFFMLEQMATKQLILQEAKAAATKDGKDASKLQDKELITAYFDKLAAGVAVTDAEAAEFYEKNKDMCGGQDLKDIKGSIDSFILNQKKQEIVEKQIQSLGERNTIEVNAVWLKRQAELAGDNPVDKARASGKPSLVDFGSKGCRPCDMLAPILETLKKKYDGKANVIFISVRDEQILAARYGIQSIPVQIFFDKDGKEVFRHAGFWPQEELEKKLGEMGVK